MKEFVVFCLGKNNELTWPLHEVYRSLLGSTPSFNVWECRVPTHQQTMLETPAGCPTVQLSFDTIYT